jgi:hypothetical protein
MNSDSEQETQIAEILRMIDCLRDTEEISVAEKIAITKKGGL